MTQPAIAHGLGAADVSPAEAAKAERELKRMQASLRGWLKYRARNDAVAQGKAESKLPADAAKNLLWRNRDWAGEQKLAEQLHTLLAEVMDASRLPDPDVRADPQAAVKLAKIAIDGKPPSEAKAPQAQGLFWVWPVVIVVGAVLFTIMTAIRSRADVQKEKERIKCIEAGACTDYGFWLKFGGAALGLWIVWDKFGAREAFKKKR